MNNRPVTLLFITSLIMIFSLPASARIKCWTNNEGVRECGKTVPPEYAQQGHEELTKHGTVADKQERAKTEEELAKLEEEKERMREEKERLKEQKKHDQILIDTFTSVEDIEAVRDDKIAALDTTISLTNKRMEKIQEDLDKRVKRAAAQERSGKEPSEKLLDSISSLKRQIKDNEAFIAEKRAEQEQIRQSFASDIARFKELKGLE
ncbi:MAG: hypothetical protein R3318_05050 [Gammaproteobacteria bacterium]|nr:hypothetical protein [Gammaproteobacteria bacterium]